jgi:hypothetical protein
MQLDHQKLMIAIANDKDFIRGEEHQAVLNVAYEEWNKPENKDWGYHDMVQWARFTFGDVAEFMILAGKYNNQVCNGGHSQYFFNGYASGDGGGCMKDHDTNCDLHRRMMDLGRKLSLDKTELGGAVFAIWKEFPSAAKESAKEAERARYDSEYNVDDDEESMYEKLDDAYYKLNDEWEKYLNNYIKSWLVNNQNPLTSLLEQAEQTV